LATRKKTKKEDATTMAARQREIAVSEFFSKNRHLLGFDNLSKALLTTVREAVDNALDACEEAHILPEIRVTIEELNETRFKVTVEDNGPGILKAQLPKIFAKLLYGSKFHRLKQSRGQQGIGISAAVMYGQMTTGQPAEVISKISKGKPAHRLKLQIDTQRNQPKVIDDVVVDNKHWREKESGTAITVTLEATYKGGKHGVAAYLHQSALSNPHTIFIFKDPKGKVHNYPRVIDEMPKEPREIKPHPHGIELGTLMHMLEAARGKTVSGFLKETFSRVSSKTAADICKAAKIKGGATASKAGRIGAESLYNSIQATKLLAPSTDCLSPIGEEALIKGLYWLFVEAQKHEAEERKRKKSQQDLFEGGEKKEKEGEEEAPEPVVEKDGENVQMDLQLADDRTLSSDQKGYFVTAVTRSPNVYRGNPFQIEVGLFYGKGLAADDQARVFRFANRVPLQYQASACAMTKAVTSTKWKTYGLSQSRGALPIGPVVIMVHMASAWVPYTSESKEAIANYDEILKELRLAINECGRRLQKFLRRKRKEADEEKKRSYIIKYMDPIGDALQEIIGFSDTERGKTVDSLREILEESRGHMPGGRSNPSS